MKTTRKEATFTPGETSTKLSLNDTEEAIFAYVHGRKPTDEERERTRCVISYPECLPTLTVKDPPRTEAKKDQSHER